MRLVNAPVPGPSSTTVLRLRRSQPPTIFSANSGELGQKAPTLKGSRRNALKKRSRLRLDDSVARAGRSLPILGRLFMGRPRLSKRRWTAIRSLIRFWFGCDTARDGSWTTSESNAAAHVLPIRAQLVKRGFWPNCLLCFKRQDQSPVLQGKCGERRDTIQQHSVRSHREFRSTRP